MKLKLLAILLLCQFALVAQNSQSVYFENGKTELNPSETQKLVTFLKKYNNNQITSFTLSIYQHEIDNNSANLDIIQKRTENLKKIITNNNYRQKIHLVFSRESKPDNVKYTKAQLDEIRTKSKKIDIAVNINQSTPTQATSVTAKQPKINKLAPVSATKATNKLSVHFEGQETKLNSIDLDKLIQSLQRIDTARIKSVTFYTYNDDSGNRNKNYTISKQRAENLKQEVNKKFPNLEVKLVFPADIKTEIKEGYSSTHLEFLRNKNRRIDVVPNTNYKGPQSKQAIAIKNAPKEKPFQFTETNNTFIIFFKGKANIQPNDDDIKKLLYAIKLMDTAKIKSITLNVYNNTSGNEKYDNSISIKRLEGVKKIISNNTNKSIITNNKGSIDIVNNEFLSELHKEFLRDKNRHVDVVTNYIGQNKKNLKELNLSFNFSPNSSLGDQIYLQNLFPDDRSVITKEMAQELDKIVLQLKKYSTIQVEIQGHVCCTTNATEAIDKDTGKVELSTNRAKAVYNYLIKKGIDPKRLRFKGYGNSKPLGNEDVFNKRTVFYIIKK